MSHSDQCSCAILCADNSPSHRISERFSHCMSGGAKQPASIAAKSPPMRGCRTPCVLPSPRSALAPPRSGRTPARRLKNSLIRIDFSPPKLRASSASGSSSLGVRGERLRNRLSNSSRSIIGRRLYNWLAHLTHPPVATSWRTNPPIHIIAIAHPTLGSVYAIQTHDPAAMNRFMQSSDKMHHRAGFRAILPAAAVRVAQLNRCVITAWLSLSSCLSTFARCRRLSGRRDREVTNIHPLAAIGHTNWRHGGRFYRISSGALTPKIPSPDARTIAKAVTKASLATVKSVRSSLRKRNCGRSLPRVQ